jgi:calcium/calmodulin-dependent protein kinase (CaM kinase) II
MNMSISAEAASLLAVNRRLLEAISAGDWDNYAAMCDEGITCFEPEAEGHLVEGLPFHKFYFDLPASDSPRQTSVSAPHVRIFGDVGVVCYVRLVQKLGADGAPVTVASNETRIWSRDGGEWKHIHFHRSPC